LKKEKLKMKKGIIFGGIILGVAGVIGAVAAVITRKCKKMKACSFEETYEDGDTCYPPIFDEEVAAILSAGEDELEEDISEPVIGAKHTKHSKVLNIEE
jgi:hypothetical protein